MGMKYGTENHLEKKPVCRQWKAKYLGKYPKIINMGKMNKVPRGSHLMTESWTVQFPRSNAKLQLCQPLATSVN